MTNMTALYHSDGMTCADQWSCAQEYHTTVPPKCGTRAGWRPACCVLAAGHPGPHLPAACA